MAKLARFEYGSLSCHGIIEDNRAWRISGDFFDIWERQKESVPLSDVRLLPPCTPTKVVAVGLNYTDHANELGMPVPEEPVIFVKPATTVCGAGDVIRYPSCAGQVDYEAELGIVIGRVTSDIEVSDAQGYILGYTCVNDVTARDLQKKDVQWTRAKSFDTFCPIGPCIETELDPTNCRIGSLLNGELKQDASTANQIFSPFFLVSFISKIMTLLPGDVIATGTPHGVGPMAVGDEIEIFVEGIGRLKNHVA